MKNLLSAIVDWLYSLRCKVSGHVLAHGPQGSTCIRCRTQFDKPNLRVKIQGIALEPFEEVVISLQGTVIQRYKPCAICSHIFDVERLTENACSVCAAELRMLKAKFVKQKPFQTWSRDCKCGLKFITTIEQMVLCPNCCQAERKRNHEICELCEKEIDGGTMCDACLDAPCDCGAQGFKHSRRGFPL